MTRDDDLDAYVEQITVDAYGDEAYWSFLTAFEEDVTFPFTASLVGMPVTVTAIDFDGDERRGLVAKINRDGMPATISILDLDLDVDLDLTGTGTGTGTIVSRLVAAYRRWLGIT